MTSQLTIAKVGGGVIDLTGFTGMKGTPYFDQNSSLIELGWRFANGEAQQGTFKVMDPAAEIPRADFAYNLPAHKIVTWIEDAPGFDCWLFRGRVISSDGGRGVTVSDNFVEFDVTVDDINRDLRYQAFTKTWTRPAETDVARLVALQAYTLNGASSTATNSGDDFEVTISTSHLCPNTATVTMPAKVYPVGTYAQSVVQDCADASGKVYGVVPHHVGGSHACLLYILEANHSTYASAVKISDNLGDWDPSDLTAPVLEPHWEAGKASLYDGQQLLSGLVSIYGTDQSVYVEDTSNITDYGYAVDTYYDSTSTTLAQATAVANGILAKRRLTNVTHRVSVVLLPAQVDLVTVGMSMQIKAAAMLGGQYLDVYQTRRVAQCTFEPRADGNWWVHLQLDRAKRGFPDSAGQAQPAATAGPGSFPPNATSWITFQGPSFYDQGFSVNGTQGLYQPFGAAGDGKIYVSPTGGIVPTWELTGDLTLHSEYYGEAFCSIRFFQTNGVDAASDPLVTFGHVRFNGDTEIKVVTAIGGPTTDTAGYDVPSTAILYDPGVNTVTNPLKFRIRFEAGVLRSRTWRSVDSEPGTWNESLTDSFASAYVSLCFKATGEGTTGPKVEYTVDNLAITVGGSGTETFTRTVTGGWGVCEISNNTPATLGMYY